MHTSRASKAYLLTTCFPCSPELTLNSATDHDLGPCTSHSDGSQMCFSIHIPPVPGISGWDTPPPIPAEVQGVLGRPFRLLLRPWLKWPKPWQRHRNRIYLLEAFISLRSCQPTAASLNRT